MPRDLSDEELEALIERQLWWESPEGQVEQARQEVEIDQMLKELAADDARIDQMLEDLHKEREA